MFSERHARNKCFLPSREQKRPLCAGKVRTPSTCWSPQLRPGSLSAFTPSPNLLSPVLVPTADHAQKTRAKRLGSTRKGRYELPNCWLSKPVPQPVGGRQDRGAHKGSTVCKSHTRALGVGYKSQTYTGIAGSQRRKEATFYILIWKECQDTLSEEKTTNIYVCLLQFCIKGKKKKKKGKKKIIALAGVAQQIELRPAN